MELDKEGVAAQLFRIALAHIWRILIRSGVPASDREDLAHEVLLAVIKNQSVYDPERGTPRAWLSGITYNLVSHYREKAFRRHEGPEDPALDVPDPTPDAIEVLALEEDRSTVAKLLERVDPALGKIVLAHDGEGVPMVDIAAELGIPTSTAYKRLYSGRAQFRRVWKAREAREKRTGLMLLPLSALGLLGSKAEAGVPEGVASRIFARVTRSLAGDGSAEALPRPEHHTSPLRLAPRRWVASALQLSAACVLGVVIGASLGEPRDEEPSRPPVAIAENRSALPAAKATDALAAPATLGSPQVATPPPAFAAVAPKKRAPLRATPPKPAEIQASAAPARSPQADVAAELRSLDAVAALIKRGEKTAAAEALAQHAQHFPEGSFKEHSARLWKVLAATGTDAENAL